MPILASPPIPAAALKRAAHRIHAIIGDVAEQVILFGSQLHGTASHDSDVDLAVIVSQRPSLLSGIERQATTAAATVLQREVDLSLYPRAEFERNRQCHLNVEHAIAGGEVLLDTGQRALYFPEYVADGLLRQEAAQRMRESGDRYLARVLRWHDLQEDMLNFDAINDAAQAVCWALRAELALCGVDTSVKAVRERPEALIELLQRRGHGFPPAAVEVLRNIVDLRSLKCKFAAEDVTAEKVMELREAARLVFETCPGDDECSWLEWRTRLTHEEGGG